MGMRADEVAAVVLLLAGMSVPHVRASTLSPAAAPYDETAVTAVTAAKESAYSAEVERFRALQSTSPDNVALVIAQCRFIGNYLDQDYGDWIAAAPDDHEACLDKLETRSKDSPEAKLHLYQQEWGDEGLAMGEALLEEAKGWPVGLRRELYATQARLYESDERTVEAGRMALQAARLGDGDSVPMAMDALLRQRDEAAAARLLRDAPAATIAWRANQRLKAAIRLQDPAVALAELRRYDGRGWVLDRALVARVYLGVGDAAAATKALGEPRDGTQEAQVRFDTALMAADVPTATAQVRVADLDDMAANLQRFAMLATQFPASLLSLPMVGMALVSGAILLCLAMLPGLLLMPVHYRGLGRRVQGRVPVPMFPAVGLRHAWWGLALMTALPFLVAGFVVPDSLGALLAGDPMSDAGSLFRFTSWSTIACLVLLVPAALSMGRGAFRGDLTWGRQVGWLMLALLVVYAVVLLQGALLRWGMEDSRTVQTETVGRMLEGGKSVYGPWLTLLVIALLVPVFEEIVFRGLLLGGMARHISFGWANTLQALLFAVVHYDVPRFFFYFSMGLVTGLLVRKTRSLTPAIALHALNNALAFWLMS